MVYTDNFTWDENMPYNKEFFITWLLPRIKPISLKIYIVTMTFHAVYCIVKLAFGSNRPLTVNADYGFDTSPSPLYEAINLMQ
ncbi:hypothetical protein L9F63_009809, partial [Diploptera punctata]